MSKYLRRSPSPPLKFNRRRLNDIQRQWSALNRAIDWPRAGQVTGIGAGVLGLWIWQWQLMLAIALGGAVMGAIYLADELSWETYLEAAYRLWQGRYRRLLLAGVGGSVAVLVSYGAIALWQSSGNPWLTSALLLQGSLISIIFLLNVRHSLNFASPLQQFEKSLADLGDRSMVRRLYAIRQLRQLLQERRLTPEQQQTLKTFLHLSWQQETESPLREALLGTLRLYQHPKSTVSAPLRLEKTGAPLNLSQPKTPLKSLAKEKV